MRKKYTSEIIHRHGEKENPKGIWQIREFLVEEDGIGVVEVILILVVLIGLVIIFKNQLTTLVNNIFRKVISQSNGI